MKKKSHTIINFVHEFHLKVKPFSFGNLDLVFHINFFSVFFIREHVHVNNEISAEKLQIGNWLFIKFFLSFPANPKKKNLGLRFYPDPYREV